MLTLGRQLEMYRSGVADVRSHPALPPQSLETQYSYDPMPADLVPPIGSNLLVHFFHQPTHAGELQDLYRRIPKKLKTKLSPCTQKGSSVGWGMALAEELDPFLFFLYGCVGFLVCSAVALIWTVINNDIQGGFGVGGFLLGFMVFCGGLVHSSVTASGTL